MKNLAKKIGIAMTATLVTSSAFAEGTPITAALNTAVSTGQANYSIVVIGLIGLAALGFGLRMIVGAMR
ncbi:TPA: hypothetical protein RQK43_000239 [Vibrio vulnificus]|nr:hypothetical protein [Vibrio vulnificus]ELV8737889.1 hypothetical protein [Vibrio vulnificus]MCU8299115.1 hypothetical protein [Vibrio vulnificus]HAS6074896.1 hypothetical protein [Vibrio vulnificus]HAS8194964.1 hypothetical protein [Vibrio vulnificus]